MNYTFRTTALDKQLLPQISAALEQHTQRISRAKYPKLWQYIDKRNSKHQLNRPRSKFFSIICLLLGIFLFVPGLMEPQELLIPLLAGTVGIGTGIGGLIRSGKNTSPFTRSAKKLMKLYVSGAEIVFSDSGMTLPNEGEILYTAMEPVIETADCLFFVFGERYLLLQKKDCPDITALQQLLAEKISA